MPPIEEIYAACMVSYAKSKDGAIFAGPAYLLVKDTYFEFDIPYIEKIFHSACGILEEVGCLKKYSHEGMQAYYRLEPKEFANAMDKSGPFDLRNYKMAKDFDSPIPEFKFLESYADLGGEFLSDALEAYRDSLDQSEEGEPEAFSSQEPEIDSSKWTGVYEVSESKFTEIRSLFVEIAKEIEQSQLSNTQRANAKALMAAAENLIDAPDPHWQLILQILSSPVLANISALAAIAISLIKS